MITRAEHLKWAKDRALAELNLGGGGYTAAMASIIQDFSLHPELEGHVGIPLIGLLGFSGHLSNATQVRSFIEELK